jgi:hypothetical protein
MAGSGVVVEEARAGVWGGRAAKSFSFSGTTSGVWHRRCGCAVGHSVFMGGRCGLTALGS